MLRLIKNIFGLLRFSLISFFSFGNIEFKYPIKFCKNVEINRRKRGKYVLGSHVSLNKGCQLNVVEDALIKIGNNSSIGSNCVITARKRITIGDNVMIGPNVCIFDHDHNYKNAGIMRDNGYIEKEIVIRNNVWIGANVTLLKGITIGEGSVIAAGSVVLRDVPENTLVHATNNIEYCVIKRKEE